MARSAMTSPLVQRALLDCIAPEPHEGLGEIGLSVFLWGGGGAPEPPKTGGGGPWKRAPMTGAIISIAAKGTRRKVLLPSPTHIEEGRVTTFFELPRLENRISRLCPIPLGRRPPQARIG